jgi:hypothetical protein
MLNIYVTKVRSLRGAAETFGNRRTYLIEIYELRIEN